MTTFGPAATVSDPDQLTSLFRLLSDKTRLSILLALMRGERNVSSLCDELHLPQPTVSHHLGLLRTNRIIANRRKGKQIFYTLHNSISLLDGQALELGMGEFAVRIMRKTG